MGVEEREEKILKFMAIKLCELDGGKPHEPALRISGEGPNISDVKIVEAWEEYKSAAREYRVAHIAMMIAERDNPLMKPDETSVDDLVIKLVVGTDDERREAQAHLMQKGEFRYPPNDDVRRPTYGHAATCGCGRLVEDLKPEERFVAVILAPRQKSMHRRFCEKCIGLSDFAGLGFATICARPGGIELLRLCQRRGTMDQKVSGLYFSTAPAPEPADLKKDYGQAMAEASAKAAAGDPVTVAEPPAPVPEGVEIRGGEPPAEERKLTEDFHAPDWEMRAGREQCRACGNWRYSPGDMFLHAGQESPKAEQATGIDPQAETAENKPEKQDA